MANFQISVELTALPGVQLQTSPTTGHQCVIIDSEVADIYVSNGKAYLTVSMWEKRSPDQYGKTHSIKQKLSKDRYNELGPDAARNMPFIGSAKPIVSNKPQDASVPAAAPSPYAQPTPYVQQPPQGYERTSNGGPLPF